MNRLQNKVCMVTGASSGIGEGIAELMVKEGAKVIIADIQEDKGNEAVKKISAFGEVAFFKLDVTNEENWQKIVEHALDRYGKLDVLVNNAGIAFSKMLIEMTLPELRKVMAVNMEGVFLGVKYCAMAMMKNAQGYGSIINISSNYACIPGKMQTAYCASKAAVSQISKVASIELTPYGIRVNTVFPGFIETNMINDTAKKFGVEKDVLLNALASQCLMNRVGKPHDIGYCVIYLASDESKFVTGADFLIDGGEVLQRGHAEKMERLFNKNTESA